MRKELAISVQSAGWYNVYGGEDNAEYALEVAKACGFEAVDFNVEARYTCPQVLTKKPSEFFSQDIETILKVYEPLKKAMEKTGIQLLQAHAPFPCHFMSGPDEFNAHLDDVLEKSCAICQYLGIPAIVMHPFIYYDRETERRINLEMYRNMIPLGKKYGVKLCLENLWINRTVMSTSYIEGACATAEEAVWYIDTLNAEAGEEIFGFCYDLGHATICKRNVRDELNILGHRLMCVHLHDNDGMNDQHFAPMIRRKTDWEGLILGLRDIGYRGAISFETGGALNKYPKELIPAMLKYIARVGKYIRDRILEEEK